MINTKELKKIKNMFRIIKKEGKKIKLLSLYFGFSIVAWVFSCVGCAGLVFLASCLLSSKNTGMTTVPGKFVYYICFV